MHRFLKTSGSIAALALSLSVITACSNSTPQTDQSNNTQAQGAAAAMGAGMGAGMGEGMGEGMGAGDMGAGMGEGMGAGDMAAGGMGAGDMGGGMAQATAPAQNAAGPIIEAIAGDVYRFKNNNHVALLINTDAGTVMVDPINAQVAASANEQSLERFGQPITHILYSHAHFDHASGASAVPNARVISHKNSAALIEGTPDMPISGRQASWDTDNDGMISQSEATGDYVSNFSSIDKNGDGKMSGQENWAYIYRDVKTPDETYDGGVNRLTIGGKVIEMHYLGGGHADDMSLIFIPDEAVLQIVDIVSINNMPWADLPWYSKEDMDATYAAAFAIPAKIVAPGHGPVGTLDDVRAHQDFMNALRTGVQNGITAGKSLEQIQADLTLSEFSHFEFYDSRRAQNIEGMHRALKAEGH